MEVKRATTFEEQLHKIKERGCIISNEEFALSVLKRINYYRLTAYFLPFRNKNGTYKPGTDFYTVYMLHEFDRELRAAIMPVIEDIELMLRTQLAYYFAHKYGPLGYLDENNFNKLHKHDRFMERIDKNIFDNRNQLFVIHHKNNYEGNFPLWVIMELFTTGELSYFYSDMLTQDRKKLADELFHAVEKHVKSWLLCLTYLRNYCAHYSRLYYTLFPAIPAVPHDIGYSPGKRLFDYLLVLKFLYPPYREWQKSVIPSWTKIIDEYKHFINPLYIGFREGWETLLY